ALPAAAAAADRQLVSVSVSRQKPAQLAAETLDVDEKRIMSLDALQGRELGTHARLLEHAGERALLGDRKQQVGLNSDHQRPLELRAPQDRLMVAMHAQVETVHRPRYV